MEHTLISVDELRTRSKSELIWGILSVVLPFAAYVIVYVFTVLAVFPSIMKGGGNPTDFFFGQIVSGLMIGFLLMGILMAVFGWIAWRKAKAVALEARAYGARRPPTSIVAHILGLSSFVGGLVTIGMALVWLVVFGVLRAYV